VTEHEWLACDDPLVMLDFLQGNSTQESIIWGNNRFAELPIGKDRKFRLLACACCRRVWNQIPEECNRDAVVATEDFLEGEISATALEEAIMLSSNVEYLEDGSGKRPEPGYWIVKNLGRGFYKMTAAQSAIIVSTQVISMAESEYYREANMGFNRSYFSTFGGPFEWPSPIPDAVVTERMAHVSMLRCLFGNPFHPTLFKTEWRTSNVLELAQTIYEDRVFDHFPILGDALMDVGCEDEEILAHCRSTGTHVRGCWLLDLILRKE
jgi:hypothetical protein